VHAGAAVLNKTWVGSAASWGSGRPCLAGIRRTEGSFGKAHETTTDLGKPANAAGEARVVCGGVGAGDKGPYVGLVG